MREPKPGTSYSGFVAGDDEYAEDEYDSDDRQVGKKSSSKNRKFVHKYRPEWEKNKDFKAWIGPSKKGNLFFFCKLCQNDNKGGLSAVKRHSTSEKHVRNLNAVKTSKTILESFSQPTALEKQAKEAEIRIAAFIAEHNIAFRSSDHLIELIKNVCPDSKVAAKMTCDYTKCSALINNVIGKTNFENLICKMKTNKFSIMVDESTDRCAEKHLAVIVRTCTDNFDVKDEFLCLLDVTDSTAGGLYSTLTNFFNEHDIPYRTNMIGFAADGTNTMMGANNSLQSLLKKDVPNLFIMKCVCHSLALCASYASEKIPDDVENLIKNIYTYFKYSSKRQIEFKNFQRFTEVKPHKLLKPCQTRWLSLHACISRVLEQWPALQLYFQAEYLLDDNAKHIFDKMTPVNKLYLQFLNHILPTIQDMNVEFQSEKPKLHYLYSRIETAFRTILDCYIDPKYFKTKNVTELQYRNPTNYTKIENVYFGADCSAALSDPKKAGLSREDIDSFRVNCLNFYVECANQIYTRFPFNTSNIQAIKNLQFLDPSKIQDTQSLVVVANFFESSMNLNLTELDREWRKLRNTDIPTSVGGKTRPSLDFWREVGNLKKGDDEPAFPLITSWFPMFLYYHTAVLQ
jgi:hypothetical protein